MNLSKVLSPSSTFMSYMIEDEDLTNEVLPLNEKNLLDHLGLSNASLFSESPSDSLANFKSKYFKNIKALIESRKTYVQNLSKLGRNWISGESFPPNDKSIKTGLEILGHIEQWYISKLTELNTSIPSIVMGPIPSGGLSIEVSPRSEVRLYINIYNNETIEMELDNFGMFEDVEANIDNFKTKLSEFLSNV